MTQPAEHSAGLAPWLGLPLAQALRSTRGHALLVQGAEGLGTLPFLMALAQSRLCEEQPPGDAPRSTPACRRCAACRLLQAHTHPDLFVLLPETLRRAEGWLLARDSAEGGGDDGKRKPSRQIRIDDVRALIEFSTRTSGRGRGKVLLIHPAEAMNAASANALLKTLEEPAPGTRLVLGTADAEGLLPTLRSRCQILRLQPPDPDTALAWLEQQGLGAAEGAGVLLAAAGGRPYEALALRAAGIDAARWQALPRRVAAGDVAAFAGWSAAQAVDALFKLCHDAWAQAQGAPPRYFESGSMPRVPRPAALARWHAELARVARHAEHPWHEPLLLEAQVGLAARAFGTEPVADAPSPGGLARTPLRYTAAP